MRIFVSSINAEELVNYLSVYESTNDKQIPFVRSINRIGWLGKEFYPCVVKNEIIFEDNEASEILSGICEHGSFEEQGLQQQINSASQLLQERS